MKFNFYAIVLAFWVELHRHDRMKIDDERDAAKEIERKRNIGNKETKGELMKSRSN